MGVPTTGKTPPTLTKFGHKHILSILVPTSHTLRKKTHKIHSHPNISNSSHLSNMIEFYLLYHINDGILAHTSRFNQISFVKTNNLLHLVTSRFSVLMHTTWSAVWVILKSLQTITQIGTYRVMNKCHHLFKEILT